ncbi:7TM diverse intracellular signaling domain-containing protein [Herbaspirillum sp. RV1423]|uniref:7TM diverse intracellular signaling domain-containing protein n=1 Tax=Herbaspirillum sp. RV1423 TaxID=1443993 RepID=UPI0009E06E9D|nr:7TM diverse intracellular signaling domain-containing protein [Herbaspirillum sp. RV1423]
MRPKLLFSHVIRAIFCILFLGAVHSSFANGPDKIFRPTENKAQSLSAYLQYLEDPEGIYNIDDVVHEIPHFKPVSGSTNLGYTKVVYWIRFTLDLSLYTDSEWFLIKEFYRGLITLYYPTTNGFSTLSVDDTLPLKSRESKLRDYIFKVPSPGLGAVTYYMRIDPRGNAIDLDFEWSGINGALEYMSQRDSWLHLFFGCLLAMWLYNAFLYFYIRDKAYLYYIYYLGCFIGIFLDATGTIALFVDIPPFFIGLFPIFTYGALHGASLFAQRFLNLQFTLPRVDQYLRYLKWVLLLGASSTLVLPISLNFYLTSYAVLAVFPVLLGAGLYRCYQGYTPAWLYCAGWLVFEIISILYILFTQGILPATSIASHGIYIAAVWESILFSLALGYRIKLIDKEKNEALEVERNQLEQRVAERTELLEASLKSRRMMLANASHELRTPVNALRLLLDSGSNHVASNAKIISNVSTITNHMSQLVENLLLLDEGAQADQRGPIKDFDLGDEIRATATMLGPLRHGSAATFNLDVDACLGVMVRGDLTSLRRVIINLLSNAFKFTERGLVTLTAAVGDTSDEGKTHCIIKVVDTGSGIPANMHDQIFGAFVTSGGQGGHTGTGLGLAISRQLAHNMDGSLILVRSAPDVGSEFEFHACFEAAAYHEAEPPHGQPALPQAAPCGRRLNVLLAEDDPITTQAVQLIVRQLQHDVTHVATYEELRQALMQADTAYDIALIDHRLPGGNGLGAIIDCRVLGRATTTRMVLVTADVTPEVLDAAREICDGIVTKPTTAHVLRQLLGEGPRTAPPLAGASAVVDVEPLKMLGRCGAKPDALARMCATFNQTVSETLADIEVRLTASGETRSALAELEPHIHRMRGSCATVGATALAEEFRKLAACDSRMTAQRQYALMVDTFHSTSKALDALLATLQTA